MQEWKARQQAYHMTQSLFRDDLNEVDIRWEPNDIANFALMHFREYVDEWIYPAKSYVVAICYATWISQDFNEHFYDVLNDKDLLFGNDPHFLPYFKSKEIYDGILGQLDFDMELGMVPDIYQYYKEEMLIGQL